MCFDLVVNFFCGIIFRFLDFCKYLIYWYVVILYLFWDCELNILEGNLEKCFFCNLRNDGYECRGRSEDIIGV